MKRYSQHAPPKAEREAILAALAEFGGVRSEAARHLGMGRTTLWRKMRESGIEVDDWGAAHRGGVPHSSSLKKISSEKILDF